MKVEKLIEDKKKKKYPKNAYNMAQVIGMGNPEIAMDVFNKNMKYNNQKNIKDTVTDTESIGGTSVDSTSAGEGAGDGSAAGSGCAESIIRKGNTMTNKQIKESLKRLDMNALDEGVYLDTLTMYEAVEPELTNDDRREITNMLKDRNSGYEKVSTYLAGVAERDKNGNNKNQISATTLEEYEKDEYELLNEIAEEELLNEGRQDLVPKKCVSIETHNTYWSPYDTKEKDFAKFGIRFRYEDKGACMDAIADADNDLGYADKKHAYQKSEEEENEIITDESLFEELIEEELVLKEASEEEEEHKSGVSLEDIPKLAKAGKITLQPSTKENRLFSDIVMDFLAGSPFKGVNWKNFDLSKATPNKLTVSFLVILKAYYYSFVLNMNPINSFQFRIDCGLPKVGTINPSTGKIDFTSATSYVTDLYKMGFIEYTHERRSKGEFNSSFIGTEKLKDFVEKDYYTVCSTTDNPGNPGGNPINPLKDANGNDIKIRLIDIINDSRYESILKSAVAQRSGYELQGEHNTEYFRMRYKELIGKMGMSKKDAYDVVIKERAANAEALQQAGVSPEAVTSILGSEADIKIDDDDFKSGVYVDVDNDDVDWGEDEIEEELSPEKQKEIEDLKVIAAWKNREPYDWEEFNRKRAEKMKAIYKADQGLPEDYELTDKDLNGAAMTRLCVIHRWVPEQAMHLIWGK